MARTNTMPSTNMRRIWRVAGPRAGGTTAHWSESADFQHISKTVEQIKRRVEAAYYYCRDDDAAAAHDDLLCAEWRLRQALRWLHDLHAQKGI